MKNKIIGLIGGMGPFASSYFYDLLLKKSRDLHGAKNNDDFPEILLDSVPVPDFISNTAELMEARKILLDRVGKFNCFGVKIAVMVCNTGHVLYDDLQSVFKGELISLIGLVAGEVKRLKLKKVGILATPTTVKLGLYTKPLARKGAQIVYPPEEFQKYHEEVIRKAVSGEISMADSKKLGEITGEFVRGNDLDGIVLGCTELPLVFPKSQSYKVIDCLEVLADNLLERYYKG